MRDVRIPSQLVLRRFGVAIALLGIVNGCVRSTPDERTEGENDAIRSAARNLRRWPNLDPFTRGAQPEFGPGSIEPEWVDCDLDQRIQILSTWLAQGTRERDSRSRYWDRSSTPQQAWWRGVPVVVWALEPLATDAHWHEEHERILELALRYLFTNANVPRFGVTPTIDRREVLWQIADWFRIQCDDPAQFAWMIGFDRHGPEVPAASEIVAPGELQVSVALSNELTLRVERCDRRRFVLAVERSRERICASEIVDLSVTDFLDPAGVAIEQASELPEYGFVVRVNCWGARRFAYLDEAGRLLFVAG